MVYSLLILLQGCASWKWYFPFHYAPFASDFKDIKDMFTDFEKGTKPVGGTEGFFFEHRCENVNVFMKP